jgi:photosystem II stability/assembly factor-like uncharacterized protein
MRFHIYLMICTLFAANISSAQRQLESFGLQGKTVAAMTFYGGALYAATANDGVYRRYWGALDTGWVSLGMPAKNLTSIFVFHTSCPLVCWKGILVGAALNPAGGNSALIYFYQQRPDTCTKKGRWADADSGIARNPAEQIYALGGIDVCHPVAPTYVTAFASTSGSIWRSEDRGQSWKEVWQSAAANIITFAARPKSLLRSDDEIWAGGSLRDAAGHRKPIMLRSTDSGEHWEDRSGQAYSGNDECRALALDPADTNTVYAALQHDIIKSQDGGKTWINTTPLDRGHYYNTLAINPQRPQHILAGGMYSDLHIQFVLNESLDGGKNWNVPVGGLLMPVASLVFDPADAQSVYLATRGSGVYRFGYPAVGVKEERNAPENFQLFANFPNPFAPARNGAVTSTAIRYHLAEAAAVTLCIYDALGREMITLINRHEPAGEHKALWNGLDSHGNKAPSGIYFYRLQAGKRVEVKKIVLTQ